MGDEENWRLPSEKNVFMVMVNPKQIRINALTIYLEEVIEFKREEIPISNDEENEKNKKESAYAVTFKREDEASQKLFIQFEKTET